jgi:hypothetical protein
MLVERKHDTGSLRRRALYSPCDQYRIVLDIVWDITLPTMKAIGLNPSTATELEDDNTVAKLCFYAKREGLGGLRMLNIFAFRATDPRVMKEADEPVGAGYDLLDLLGEQPGGVIVAMWGAHGKHMGRGAAVKDLLVKEGLESWCFGMNKDGSPTHPLYLPNAAPLRRFTLARLSHAD